MRVLKLPLFIILLICTITLSACSSNKNKEDLLDASNPLTITLWHYYNGQVKDNFDSLVEKFNETVGISKGIIVESKSLGNINQLADVVFNSANDEIGSQPLPNIFMSYPSNAYRVDQVSELVDLKTLFTKEELSKYRDEFLEEGILDESNKLKIIPIAKSTENLFLNKTFWDDFSSETGADIEDLKTWEGIVEVAKLYKEHTGKAFIGIDAVANYMLVSSVQLGEEIYNYEKNKVTFNFKKDNAKIIWDNYYIPYMNGYFEKKGRYSSDDAKTGDLLAYIGSTASSAYFPSEVTIDQSKVIEIEASTLPYPVFKEGKPYAIQQGAGMCVTKSDDSHEYACALFLKWFTQTAQNVNFAVSTGYFPVLDESLKRDVLVKHIESLEVVGKAIPSMIESTDYMFNNYTLYSEKPFDGSYELRNLLESHLFDKIKADLEALNNNTEHFESRISAIEHLTSDLEFEKWYNDIINQATSILNQ